MALVIGSVMSGSGQTKYVEYEIHLERGVRVLWECESILMSEASN